MVVSSLSAFVLLIFPFVTTTNILFNDVHLTLARSAHKRLFRREILDPHKQITN